MRATRFAGFVLASLLAGLVLLLSAPGPATLLSGLGRLAAHPLATLDTYGAEQAAVTVAAGAAWLLLGWLAAAGLLTAGGQLSGLIGQCARALARLVVPRAARPLLCAMLGIGILTVSGPASAAGDLVHPRHSMTQPAAPDADLDWPITRSSRAPQSLDVNRPHPPSQLPNDPRPPDRADVAEDPAVDPERHATRNAPVTVRPGDSLWSIAAGRIGAGAADSRVAQEWPLWWAANRAVIGDDPDLINPGQRLIPPALITLKEQHP